MKELFFAVNLVQNFVGLVAEHRALTKLMILRAAILQVHFDEDRLTLRRNGEVPRSNTEIAELRMQAHCSLLDLLEVRNAVLRKLLTADMLVN